MNEVLARPPVSIRPPVVALEKPSARPTGQDQICVEFEPMHVGQRQSGQRNVVEHIRAVAGNTTRPIRLHRGNVETSNLTADGNATGDTV